MSLTQDRTTAIAFNEHDPEVISVEQPVQGNHFCLAHGDPVSVTAVMRGRPLVKGVYGDPKKQPELREGFDRETDKLLVFLEFVSPEQREDFEKWLLALKAKADAHYDRHTVKRKNAKGASWNSPLRDDGSVKFNLPVSVAEHCSAKENLQSIFDICNGIFDVVFDVSGFWRNNKEYGVTFTIRKLAKVLSLRVGKRKAPEDLQAASNKYKYEIEEGEIVDDDNSA